MSSLTLLAVLSAHAADPALPLRPTTYVVNDALTSAPLENFREVYVQPAALIKDLEPVEIRTHKKVIKRRVKLTKDKLEITDKIFFVTGKSEIQDQSFPLLDEIAGILVKHPEVTSMRIEGHTDSRGSARANKSLSQQRANSVRKYLIGKDVEARRLKAVGYGESRPLVDEENEAAWEKNRRVEFTVLGHNDKLAKGPMNEPEKTLEESIEPASADLPIVNDGSATATVAINGTKVGKIGPFTNSALRGVPGGYYNVEFTYENGFQVTHKVHTLAEGGPIVPGGPDAKATLGDDETGTAAVVPSWHDDPSKGYNEEEGGTSWQDQK